MVVCCDGEWRTGPRVAGDRFGHRLLSALAGTTRAFARPPADEPATRGRRVLSALAGSTAAFAPGPAAEYPEPDAGVSNILQIAKSVRLGTTTEAGRYVGQRVFYMNGADPQGTLDTELSTMYRQLALNWEPGDQIFIFGFSRGAYTARSLAGMIGRFGLMGIRGIAAGRYPEVLAYYRERKQHPDEPDPPHWTDFRAANCHYPVPIEFLGVFDTVGAMGVPGLRRWRYRFPDMRLSPYVQCARQVLAIDERRRVFAPCLWEVDDAVAGPLRSDRIEQVWFKGGHTDIGGGNADSRLSDPTLRWMVNEAAARGLVFEREPFEKFSESGAFDASAQPRNELTVTDRLLNLIGRLLDPQSPYYYPDSWRRLDTGTPNTYLSNTVVISDDYRPPNLERWQHELARQGKSLPYEPGTDAAAATSPRPEDPQRTRSQ
nr:DUF2235 domain-containing protein [Nocardia transvalensis]